MVDKKTVEILSNDINKLKQQLIDNYQHTNCFTDPKLVELSQKLDRKLNEYNNITTAKPTSIN